MLLYYLHITHMKLGKQKHFSSSPLNPLALRHLIAAQYCAMGGFSTWVFKHELESAKH
jgi:hypothetical protein